MGRPRNVEELQSIVEAYPKVKAVGVGHRWVGGVKGLGVTVAAGGSVQPTVGGRRVHAVAACQPTACSRRSPVAIHYITCARACACAAGGRISSAPAIPLMPSMWSPRSCCLSWSCEWCAHVGGRPGVVGWLMLRWLCKAWIEAVEEDPPRCCCLHLSHVHLLTHPAASRSIQNPMDPAEWLNRTIPDDFPIQVDEANRTVTGGCTGRDGGGIVPAVLGAQHKKKNAGGLCARPEGVKN